MDDGCIKSESKSKQTRGGHGGGGYNKRFEEVLLDGCHYRIYGNNNTPTTTKKKHIPTVCVFFIPGFGDTSACFDPFILSLVDDNDDDGSKCSNNNNNNKHFKAITMDLPGCGSNYDTIFNDVDEIIGWIMTVLEGESLDKNIIIGHSLGGLFALRAMGKIIISNSDIIPSIKVDGCYLIEATLLDSDRSFFESLDIKCIDPVNKFVSLFDSSMVPEGYLHKYKQNVSRMSSRMFCLYTTNVIQFLQQNEQKKLLSSLVSIPISYVYGVESPSQSDREILSSKYTNISIKKFINTAHWPHIDVQRDVISHFETFLNEVIF